MTPVLIVGGGPVGLTAALRLAQAGVAVELFEAESSVPTDLRASTFHPPTLHMPDTLGVGAELLARGRLTPRWQVRRAREYLLVSSMIAGLRQAGRIESVHT